jgi:hypothetical protein
MNKSRALALTLTGLAMTGMLLVTGCATKGPKRVYAAPFRPEPNRVAPANQAIADAPRTQPGKVMDPDAITYAQVPARIIYLPGQHGIFGRESARQEVAYNLVPVDRIGAIQAEGTPEFGEIRTGQGPTVDVKVDVTEMTISNPDGSFSKGQARRLGVLGQSEAEKSRAGNLLQRGEELQWSTEIGWVGFRGETKAKGYEPDGAKKEAPAAPGTVTPPATATTPDIEPLGEPGTGVKPPEPKVEEELELELGPKPKDKEEETFSFE